MDPEELDKTLTHLYQSAQSASSEGLTDEALHRCEQALELIETWGDDAESHGYSDFIMLKGDIQWGAGNYEEAFQAYHRVALNDPDRHDARVAVGVALFHLCRFHSAREVLEKCSADDPDNPETWYYLGLIALRFDERPLALRYFDLAHDLNEERYQIPVEITEEEIRDIVDAQIETVPEQIREVLANVPIILEKRPSMDLLFSENPPMDPTLLGIFEGIPYPDSGPSTIVTTPTRIVLFTENIWLVANDRETLEEEIWVTLKHEIGHFLGLDEDDLAERGLD